MISTSLIPAWLQRPLRWFLNRTLLKNKNGASPPCERCGESLPRPASLSDALFDMLITCPRCGHSVSLLSTFISGKSEVEIALKSAATSGQPAVGRVVTERVGDKSMWQIPAKGGCSFLIGFGIIWTALSSLILAGSIIGEKSQKLSLVLFISVFVLIGITILYFGFRMSFTRHTLWLDAETLTHDRHFFRHTRRVTFLRETIRRVELVVFYEQNYKPVHGIEIRSDAGKMRFGSQLNLDEKAWLVQDIRSALEMDLEPKTPDVNKHQADATPSPAETGGMMLHEDSNGCIVGIPPSKFGRWLFFAGIFFTGIAGFMLYQGLSMFLHEPEHAPIFFRIFSGGFGLFWCAGVGMGVLFGLGMLIIGWRQLTTRTEVSANSTLLLITTTTGSRTTEQTYPRSDVSDVRVTPCISSRNNGVQKTTYRIEVFLQDRVWGIGFGQPRERLESVAVALRKAMKIPDASQI